MTIDNFNKIGKRPFRVNLQGDVEMAQGRTFDTQGSRVVNLPAPVSASEPQRAGDHVSHINIRAGGNGPTEVVINEELITQHGYNPEHTHVTVRFTQGGEKRVVLDTGAVGLLVTVYKSAAASSIVIEPGDGRTFRGSSAPVEVQPAVAAKRSFTIASIGNDWDFVGVPNIDGGVEGHMLRDESIKSAKLDRLDLEERAGEVELIAHRGFRSAYVQNTAHALIAALRSGADSVECDVQTSTDGTPWLFHDATVDDLTNGSGTFTELSDATIAGLKYTEADSTPLEGIGIPKLAAVVELLKSHRCRFYPEVKGYGNASQIEAMVNLVKSAGLSKRTMWQSFTFSDLQAVNALDGECEVGFLVNSTGSPSEATLKGHIDNIAANLKRGTLLAAYQNFLNHPSIVEYARSKGVGVGAWTVNDSGTALELISLGVHRIMSDRNLRGLK